MSDEKENLANLQPTEPEDGRWSSPFAQLLEQEVSMPDDDSQNTNFQAPDPNIGTPAEDSAAFPGQQSYTDTCAIRCQEFILEQYTGTDYNEDELIREAEQNGWYVSGEGTAMEDVGNLLELHGIPVNRYQDASVFHLAQELGQGHKVIIGVDSGELWGGNSTLESIKDFFGLDGADHAVVVSGIDTSDPDETRVIVSDPGTGEAVASYPLEQFLDAWQDSDFSMVATQQAAPNHLPEMANFDYESGHISQVAGMPWEQFETFAAQPEVWDSVFEEQSSSPDAEAAVTGVSESVYSGGNSLTSEESYLDNIHEAEMDRIEMEGRTD